MKKERFTKQQIITILKEHEAGIKIPELSQQHGVSAQSIYRWKAKYRRFVVFVHSTSKFVGAVLGPVHANVAIIAAWRSHHSNTILSIRCFRYHEAT